MPRESLMSLHDSTASCRGEENMTLRVAVGGFGAIGKVVAQRLDEGIEGLALAAV